MTRTWPVVAATVAASLLAGVAIAGLPGEADDFVIDASAPTPTSISTQTTIPVPVSTETTVAVTSTTAAVTSTTAAPETTSTTVPATTIDAAPTLLDRSEVRVVLANGVGVGGLVSSTAQTLRSIGYSQISGGDVTDRPGRSVVYYVPGFDDEAARLATDLELAEAFVVPLPDQPVTDIDASGDVIVILGADFIG